MLCSREKRPLTRSTVLALGTSAILTGIAAGGDLAASRPHLRFGSDLEVVNLNLIVTDVRERFVTDLTEEEVAIFEDGVPQAVALFTRQRLPLSLAILVDCSTSMTGKLVVTREAARRLIGSMQAGDEALVACFNQNYRVLQDYTSHQDELERALGSLTADGSTGLYSALYVALRELAKRGSADQMTRRAIVVLSDGEDTSSLVTEDQVLECARKAGVTVYTVSLRALHTIPQLEQHRAAFFMKTIARVTGGRACFPEGLGKLDGVYETIAEELRTQYGLGYVSNNPARNGRWRRIAIQSRRDNLQLRYRTGYYAPRLTAQVGLERSGHPTAASGTTP
jgi:Ca-activated chloride channel homolog